MKNVLKIAIVPCCIFSFYHNNVYAAERVNSSSESFVHQNKLHPYKNGRALARTQVNPSMGKSGWYTDNNRISIKYSEAKQIGLYEHAGLSGKLYVYQAPSFTSPQWQEALNKGLAERAKGQNGIKVLSNLIELKINADARLYTTRLYKNDEGHYIAILDKEARHKEIRRKNNKNKFEIQNCYSVPSGIS
jgi:hypothetical protein